MNTDWIVLGKGIGIRLESTYLHWIYWAPGTSAREGLRRWGQETKGVVPWRAGQPRHLHRPDDLVVAELIEAGMADELSAEAQRSQPSAAEKQRIHFGRIDD